MCEVREDYSADGDAWSRKLSGSFLYGLLLIDQCCQTSLTIMRDQGHSDGVKMESQVSQIPMACRTLHLLSGTGKSKCTNVKLKTFEELWTDDPLVTFSKNDYSVSRIHRAIMERASRRHTSTLTILLRFVKSIVYFHSRCGADGLV